MSGTATTDQTLTRLMHTAATWLECEVATIVDGQIVAKPGKEFGLLIVADLRRYADLLENLRSKRLLKIVRSLVGVLEIVEGK